MMEASAKHLGIEFKWGNE